jgi:hypothetical protein
MNEMSVIDNQYLMAAEQTTATSYRHISNTPEMDNIQNNILKTNKMQVIEFHSSLA